LKDSFFYLIVNQPKQYNSVSAYISLQAIF